MSEQITTGIQKSRPSALTLIVIAVSTLILASCGGGSESTPAVETADGTKQALGVSGATATVPGGWTDRKPLPAPSIINTNDIIVTPGGPGSRNTLVVVIDSAKFQAANTFLISKGWKLISQSDDFYQVSVGISISAELAQRKNEL